MKKPKWIRAAAALLTLALALVMIGVPKRALANVDTLTFSPTSPQHVLVGATVSNITASVTQSGATQGTVTYTWTNNNPSLFSISSTSGNPITVTGLAVGTGTITVNAKDEGDVAGSLPGVTQTYTIIVDPMTVSPSSSIIGPGATTTLTAANFTGTITSWTSSNPAVATVASSGATTATVTGVGSGTTTITAYNTPAGGAPQQTATATITVPTVTLSPSSQTLTAANTPTTLTLTVLNGGSVIPSGTATVNWSNSDPTIGSLSATTSTVSAGGVATIGFTSSTGGINGTTTITATVGGFTRTATVTVSTARYLDIVGPNDLNRTTRTGTYTVYLKNPDGTVYNDSTSTVHWDWSGSYLSLTSDPINNNRSHMHSGEAHIQLYAKYNTPSGGTRLYAWINSDTGGRVYHTIYITGLSSLPQTGQNMTLVYVFGALSAALLVAAGVWYGIRKKHSAA